MAAVSTSNAEHYTWGQASDGWHLLAADDLSVIEERMPPGAFEQRHRHVHSRQFFYVLEGEATLELDGTSHRLHRGEGLHVAPGSAHQMRNESNGEVRFVVISAPKSHGDRVAAPLETVIA
ncbi:cupin domain-containing protein [Dyella caseinilytica]|uniref:Cupin domain-containing protein n=1 Tax=Dyella caseinilytica TaxID=1849581 RepID=A0ABX7GW52_9GAMM|nr:cupin domain-containing protein [Dyella caseinilytica]QRN54698.1 cupin domain-containing protein [Dyella caseinilytica]GFZ96147.1 cupin [Dyella caseinilytica]